MTIERALLIDGFMSEVELAYLAKVSGRSYCIVEVGSYQGRSARAIADNTSGVLFCVDTWRDGGEDAFDANLADLHNVVKIKMDSRRGAAALRKAGIVFDMIFIDADHDYANVRADIEAWKPLLADSGILCGHDFGNLQWPDVEKAVKDLVPNFSVVESIWTTEREAG